MWAWCCVGCRSFDSRVELPLTLHSCHLIAAYQSCSHALVRCDCCTAASADHLASLKALQKVSCKVLLQRCPPSTPVSWAPLGAWGRRVQSSFLLAAETCCLATGSSQLQLAKLWASWFAIKPVGAEASEELRVILPLSFMEKCKLSLRTQIK